MTKPKPTRAVVMHGAQARRMGTSRNGNPGYQLVGKVDDPEVDGPRWLGLFTGPDSMCAYSVPNVFGAALDRTVDVRLVLNARGYVVGVEAVEPQV
jgi:hypothetical protein